MTYGDKAAYSEYIIQTLGVLSFFFLFLRERNPVEFKHVGQSFKLRI